MVKSQKYLRLNKFVFNYNFLQTNLLILCNVNYDKFIDCY